MCKMEQIYLLQGNIVLLHKHKLFVIVSTWGKRGGGMTRNKGPWAGIELGMLRSSGAHIENDHRTV